MSYKGHPRGRARQPSAGTHIRFPTFSTHVFLTVLTLASQEREGGVDKESALPYASRYRRSVQPSNAARSPVQLRQNRPSGQTQEVDP